MNDSLTVEDPPNLNVITGVEGLSALPESYALEQNYPNPFNPATVIRYSLPVGGQVSLMVYDMLGREVARLVDGGVTAGVHEVTFDASGLPSGVYFCSLRVGGFAVTRKLVVLR
jgi:hypothetical protein